MPIVTCDNIFWSSLRPMSAIVLWYGAPHFGKSLLKNSCSYWLLLESIVNKAVEDLETIIPKQETKQPKWRKYSLYFEYKLQSANMTSIQALKAVLRQEIKTKLNNLSKSEKDIQSEIIVKQFLQLPAYRNSKRISVYLSTENEISTEAIVRQIFLDNKECFVPRYNKKNMEMVKLSSMHDWETLPLTPWNIKQPSLKEARENAMDDGGLDLIVVPGVAFTKNGKRMGHGGGYYDKFLELNQKREKPPTTIALAFKEQIVENMPTHEYDRNIDQVLFTNGI